MLQGCLLWLCKILTKPFRLVKLSLLHDATKECCSEAFNSLQHHVIIVQPAVRACDCCRECDQGDMRELVPGIAGADPTAAGLLIECRANTEEGLDVSSFGIPSTISLESHDYQQLVLKALPGFHMWCLEVSKAHNWHLSIALSLYVYMSHYSPAWDYLPWIFGIEHEGKASLENCKSKKRRWSAA